MNLECQTRRMNVLLAHSKSTQLKIIINIIIVIIIFYIVRALPSSPIQSGLEWEMIFDLNLASTTLLNSVKSSLNKTILFKFKPFEIERFDVSFSDERCSDKIRSDVSVASSSSAISCGVSYCRDSTGCNGSGVLFGNLQN